MTHVNPNINELEVTPFNDAIVTVTLRSIRQQVDLVSETPNKFNVRFIVNDGIDTLDYQEIIKLIPGEVKLIQGVSHNFVYEDTSCKELLDQGMTFFSHVVTKSASVCKDYHAKGKLKPGKSIFRIPIELIPGNRKNMLVLRGTIHVSCSA